MSSIVFFLPSAAHYSETVFQMLIERYRNDILFIAGENFQGIHDADLPVTNYRKLKYRSYVLLGNTFVLFRRYFRSFSLRRTRTVVISGVDFHLPQFIIMFFLCRFRRIKIVWWTHGTLGNQGKFGTLLRSYFYNRADAIWVYSDEGKRNMMGMGVGEADIYIIGNCLNHLDYGFMHYPRERLIARYPSDRKKILFSGRLNENKNIDILLKALLILDNSVDYLLDIIGDGKQREKITSFIEQNNLSAKVRMHGAKNKKEAHKFFLEADLFVVPGPIGLSIVHAFSFGIPVITVNPQGGASPETELLHRGKNGDFYMPGDHIDLAEKIKEWLSKRDISQYRQYAIETVEKYDYTPEKVSGKMIRSLIKLIESE